MGEQFETSLADIERAVNRAMRIPELANGNADLLRRARWMNCSWQLGIGTVVFHVTHRDGAIESFDREPKLMQSWDFFIRGDTDAWLDHWQPVPSPMAHDIFALQKHGRMLIGGTLHPLMSNLQVIKDIVALPRTVAAEA